MNYSATYRAAGVAIFAYESAAIASNGRIPTITAMQCRHHVAGVAIIGWLVVHFYRADRGTR